METRVEELSKITFRGHPKFMPVIQGRATLSRFETCKSGFLLARSNKTH